MIKEKDLIIRVLEALFPSVKIYLFGSRAKGTNRPASDIDLAIDIGRQLTFLELARAKEVLQGLYIPEKIDVVDMHAIAQEFKETILKEGIVWKS